MQSGLLTTYREPTSTRGPLAWAIAAALTGFYLLLYLPGSSFTPGFPDLVTPVSSALGFPSKWLFYAALYSLGMGVGGWFMLRRHGNSRYHRLRTFTLVAVQVILAFLLPWAMEVTIHREYYLSYFWPLSRYTLYPQTLRDMPVYVAAYFVLGSLVALPALAFYKGKRVYCSWICGCGGLAETFGDPWRHLSDKSARAWKMEQVSIYSVLVLIVVTTALMLADGVGVSAVHGAATRLDDVYGFFVGALFSGVIGVGLYPLMGTRVWCRFGCPMAAMLGIAQVFGRFRVAVKKGMCIGCGNCSTYCEMGIDVRRYAMANEDVVRASCVGCGMCAHVCPRGVLRLTTRPTAAGPVEEWTLDL